MTSRPRGKRFTDVYREKASPIEDSARFRRRLAHKLVEMADWDIIQGLRSETGHNISSQASSKWWLDFVAGLELDELLDFVTITVEVFLAEEQPENAAKFVQFIRRAMAEENLAFEMDDLGGVHHRIDTAFQTKRRAALEALEGAQSVAAREAFEEAHQALTGHPADTLAAVRRAFDAVENLFKMEYGTSRLGSSEIKAKMKSAGTSDGKTAADASGRLNAAFAEWVNACHQYRHAAGEPDPSPPPRWLATTLVDGAATYIRYLSFSQAFRQ